MKKLKVGIVGVGKLGSLHARIYSQLKSVELVGICDINPQVVRSLARELNTTGWTDYTKLFKKVEVVSIATPTYLHYKIAKDFLKNRINVLIEKPITKTLKEADELIKLSEKLGLTLQVGHVERFNSAIRAIEEWSPKPKFIECHRLGPFTPRVKDVGVVLDLMIHDIDIVLSLVPSKIKDIQAIGMKVLTKHEDIANARLKFENGTVCDLTASRVTKDVLRKIRIFQEDAYISLDYKNEEALIYKKIKDKIISRKIDIKKEQPLKIELTSFVDCILNKKRPIVSGKEARDALRVALLILSKIKKRKVYA